MTTDTDAVLGPDEDAFLRAHSRTFLLGVRADGSPTGWPMVGIYPGDALEFSTYRRSQKVRDFERNPNACCVVAPVESERALVLRGTAAVVLGRQELPVRVDALPDVNVDTTTKDAAEAKLRSGQRVVLRVEPGEARFVPGWAATAERAGGSG
jgi:nitroimidazol reductase NimA-like FMN-containing flavoprotein (pyridoxamine 5'-phosphate oxidase superfamily)